MICFPISLVCYCHLFVTFFCHRVNVVRGTIYCPLKEGEDRPSSKQKGARALTVLCVIWDFVTIGII